MEEYQKQVVGEVGVDAVLLLSGVVAVEYQLVFPYELASKQDSVRTLVNNITHDTTKNTLGLAPEEEVVARTGTRQVRRLRWRRFQSSLLALVGWLWRAASFGRG